MILKKLTYSILVILTLSFLISCSEYQKILKSSDYNKKYDKALELYNEKDYFRAHTLFEELLSVYKGTDRAEEIYYYYAYCFYGENDFMMAGYHFKNYIQTYPFGKRKEECHYLAAYCYYLNSPEYTLDQSYTVKAIEELQLFINRYPKSDKIADANNLIDKLRNKLESKSFHNAKLYYDIGDYKASIQSLKSSIREFPDSDYREEILFLILKSNYLLAQNSIIAKKSERFQKTLGEYDALIVEFPDSRFKKEADRILENTKKQLNIN